jgi:hypothetical protein
MKAMLEARIVAANTHFPDAAAQGAVGTPARMTLSSQGSRTAAIILNLS